MNEKEQYEQFRKRNEVLDRLNIHPTRDNWNWPNPPEPDCLLYVEQEELSRLLDRIIELEEQGK